MAFSIERTRTAATDIARDAERHRADLQYLEARTDDLKGLSDGIRDSWIDEEAIESTLGSVADELDQVEGMRQSALEEARKSRAALETLREDTESAREQTQGSRQELEAESRQLESSGLPGALDDAIAETDESSRRLADLGRFLDETASELDDIIDGFGSPGIGYDEDGRTDVGAKTRNEAVGKVAEGIAAAESLVLEGADERLQDQQLSGAIGQMSAEGLTLDDMTAWARERTAELSESMTYAAVDADARDYQAELNRSLETQGHVKDIGLGAIAGIGLAVQGIKNVRKGR
ncbi:MAG: hypothetical protein J6D54_13810 [Olsenella sp.]|nr:hypothetical protein [Olsenella sp.]